MKIHAFSKTYEGRTVLDFPGTELEPGRICAVIGANGSGKSTFAKILSGVLKPDRRGPLSDAKTVGFMPQKNYAFRMTTKANILLNGPDEARADRLMEAIQLTELSSKRADKLSGGETARMALTTLLSEKLIVEYVRETGCALILVTHSLQQARRIADEVWYFHKGSLLEAGAKEQVLDTPKRAETKQFLEFYGV